MSMIWKLHKSNKKITIAKLLMSFLLISGISHTASAQQNFLDYELKIKIEKGGLDQSKITITKNGSLFRVIDSKSKYNIELDFGVEYVFTVSKAGYITKSIVVDTHIPDGRDQEEFVPFESLITLFPQPEDLEITYTQPVGRIEYSNSVGDFDFDKDYAAKSIEAQKQAEAAPKPKPKPKQEPIVSNPEKVEKKVEYKTEPTPPKPVVKNIDPPPTPVVRTVVETTVQQDKLKITYRTVTINGVEFVYRKEEFSWGGVYFYKDTKNITENTYEKDTK